MGNNYCLRTLAPFSASSNKGLKYLLTPLVALLLWPPIQLKISHAAWPWGMSGTRDVGAQQVTCSGERNIPWTRPKSQNKSSPASSSERSFPCTAVSYATGILWLQRGPWACLWVCAQGREWDPGNYHPGADPCYPVFQLAQERGDFRFLRGL